MLQIYSSILVDISVFWKRFLRRMTGLSHIRVQAEKKEEIILGRFITLVFQVKSGKIDRLLSIKNL